MGTDEKYFSAYRSPTGARQIRVLRRHRIPVVPVRREPENEKSKLRVLLLPLPRRRRRKLADGQPHHNENRKTVFMQAATLLIGLGLFIFATAYFFYRLSPALDAPLAPDPEFVHDPKFLRTNLNSGSLR